MTILFNGRALTAWSHRGSSRVAVFAIAAAALLVAPFAQAVTRSAEPLVELPRQHITNTEKGSMKMSRCI